MWLRYARRCARIGFFAAASGIFCAEIASASSVVDRAEIRVGDDTSDVEIKFNVPINIGVYAPATHGELLQITIELPEQSESNGAVRLGATEWIAGSQPSAYTLYEYLRFDRASDPRRGRIVIKFLHDVNFSIEKSPDARGVVISIAKANIPKQRPEKLAGQSNLLPETLRVPSTGLAEIAAAAAAEKAATPVPMTLLPAQQNTNIDFEKKPAPPAEPTAVNSAADDARAFTKLSEYSRPEPASSTVNTETKVSADVVAAGENATKTSPRIKPINDGWRVYGSVSQYYDYSDVKISRSGDPRSNISNTQTSQNDLRSNLNLNARYRDEDWDIRSRFGGGYRVDFLDHSRDTFHSRYAGNKFLLSDAYVDARNHRTEISAKVGRQYGSTGGVFGRFDGAQIGVPLGGDWRGNIVVGSPVDLIYDKTVDNTNSIFYGANFDFAPKGSHWQTNFYTMQETIDGVIGRRALGNETRYYGTGKSLLTLVDYDIEYRALNRAMAISNWSPTKTTALNATIDFGYSPLLTTRNALISQPDCSSIKQMQQVYSNAEIEQLARDRSAKYHNIMLSVTQQLNELAQVYGSVGQYYYGAMPASGGVEAMPTTGNEYDYSLQYIRTSLLQQNDTHTFGLRYYSGSTARRVATGIDARYTWGNWRVNPRLWIERRKNLSDASSEWVYRPGVRVEYSFLRRYHIEFEASSDMYKGTIPEVGSQDIVGNFVQLGYRVDID